MESSAGIRGASLNLSIIELSAMYGVWNGNNGVWFKSDVWKFIMLFKKHVDIETASLSLVSKSINSVNFFKAYFLCFLVQ